MISLEPRALHARRARPSAGGNGIEMPLITLANEVGSLRRPTLYVWARRSDKEQSRDIRKRVIRCLGAGVIPAHGEANRDLPLEPLDLVLTVAGMIWPGMAAWKELGRTSQLVVDFWWGWDGRAPGAAVIRDGVLHLVFLDRDADQLARGDWAMWAASNWKGPVLHHGIQLLSEDEPGQITLVEELRKKASQGGCILWPSQGGKAIRPFRVDYAGQHALLRPVGEGIRLCAARGASLEMRVELLAMGTFFDWLRGMVVPDGARGLPPSGTFLETPMAKKRWGGKQGATRGQRDAGFQQPLLEEVLNSGSDEPSSVEREFGIKLSEELGPARIRELLATAEQELMRAYRTGNRPKADHWRQVLNEIEPFLV